MCGIYGVWSTQKNEYSKHFLDVAGATISHRGPDHQGVWFDPVVNLGLGHRRLSILDLSPQGHQPMHSAEGRYVITFNGEIYNFETLKADLERLGHRFRGHSDTEVMLAAISQWGLAQAVQKFVGMFAFALWDRETRTLSLCRDRFGEKPLYYGWLGQSFVFGSELKALRSHPEWQGTLDRQALALFLRLSYVPAPYSIYAGIQKLLPGTLLTVEAVDPQHRPTPQPYWSLAEVTIHGQQHPFEGDDEAAIAQLESLLRQTIQQQMVADVPLGAFLSGGVDSSTVAALMQAHSPRPIKTFTIGFPDAAYNEAEDAQAVAHYLQTDHTELYVTPAEAQAVIPQLPTLYDEPFADPSQIPTYLVSQLARRQVTVSLSGDGGDEIFGGYNRYLWANRIWQQMGWLPLGIRGAIAQVITNRSPNAWNQTVRQLAPLLPKDLQQRLPGEKLHKLAGVLAADSPEALYGRLVSHWQTPAALVRGMAQEPTTPLTEPVPWSAQQAFIPWMMYLDSVTYLPGDVLTKVDRAAMGVSLETRIPFLDHRLVEFASTLPLAFKIRPGQGKWLLRQVLYRHLPASLIERPKMGFSVPIDDWLRGPLRDWAGDLLQAQRMQQAGLLAAAPIQQKWLSHLSGNENAQYPLWNVIIFQAWLEKYGVS